MQLLETLTAVNNMRAVSSQIEEAIKEISVATKIMADFSSEVQNQNNSTDDTLEILNSIMNQYQLK